MPDRRDYLAVLTGRPLAPFLSGRLEYLGLVYRVETDPLLLILEGLNYEIISQIEYSKEPQYASCYTKVIGDLPKPKDDFGINPSLAPLSFFANSRPFFILDYEGGNER